MKLTSSPRSYLVLTERGNILRRNRKDLLLIVPCQNCPYMKDNCSDYDDQQTNFNEIYVNIAMTITGTKNTGLAQGD